MIYRRVNNFIPNKVHLLLYILLTRLEHTSVIHMCIGTSSLKNNRVRNEPYVYNILLRCRYS